MQRDRDRYHVTAVQFCRNMMEKHPEVSYNLQRFRVFDLCSLTLCNECLNGADRLCLLFGSRDGRGRVALLRTVVAKLGVIAACDLYHIFGVVQFVFDALVE